MSGAEASPVVNPHRHSDAAAFLAALLASPATAAEFVGTLAQRAVVAADLLHKALQKQPGKGDR